MNLEDMIKTNEFEMFDSDNRGNDLFINDPDRADRLHKSAEYGSDGSYHYEIIQDWRDFLYHCADELNLNESQIKSIQKEIDDCEQWHEKNGSLHDQLS